MKVLVCDDSVVARKGLARYLLNSSEQTVVFAKDGQEALDIIDAERIDVLFLDLTMPVLDGFGVLEGLQKREHSIHVVVVSADIQEHAQKLCLELGAYGFIGKPVEINTFTKVCAELGVMMQPSPIATKQNISQSDSNSQSQKSAIANQDISSEQANANRNASLKEIANIAVGKTAALIGLPLDRLIHLPIPNVGLMTFGEICMTLKDAVEREESTAISQRFIGPGIHGESIVFMRGKDIHLIGDRLGFSFTETTYNEVALNVSNIAVSAFLTSIGKQLGVEFSFRQPIFLDEVNSYLYQEPSQSVLTIEYTYSSEGLDFECEVLLLIELASLPMLDMLIEGV